MGKFSDIAPAPAPRTWTGEYLSGQEKQAALGSVMSIRHAEYKPNGYMGKAEWDIGVIALGHQAIDAETGEVRDAEYTITFTDNPVRGAMFTAVTKALAEGETIDPVVFCEVGKARAGGNAPLGFRDATPEEVAAATTARMGI